VGIGKPLISVRLVLPRRSVGSARMHSVSAVPGLLDTYLPSRKTARPNRGGLAMNGQVLY
jgi:hypothetical protein